MIFQPAKFNYWAVKDAKGVIAGYGETQPGEITYVNPEYSLVTASDLTTLAGLLKVSPAEVQTAAFGLNRKGME